jgi:hypothetical protein
MNIELNSYSLEYVFHVKQNRQAPDGSCDDPARLSPPAGSAQLID